MYGEGISKEGSLIDIGTEMDIVDKSGAWYSFEGERLGQGRENAKQYLKDNHKVTDIIEKKIREATITIPAVTGAAADDDAEDLDFE
jgi:recombination protein RecA